MYFIANRAQPGGVFTTSYGPFETREAAIEIMAGIKAPGEYQLYGPAEPLHAVRIAGAADGMAQGTQGNRGNAGR